MIGMPNSSGNDMDNISTSENNHMSNSSHSYLSNASYSHDQYSSINGQYGDSNFSGWNSGVTSRGSPQASMEHPQLNSRADRNSMGGFNHNHSMSMHSQDSHGQGQGQGQGQLHSSQRGHNSDMPFIQPQQHHQMNYNVGNDFNSPNGGGYMVSVGMHRSNNRFASSQMSQMGQNQSGSRNYISGPSGTGGSNAQGRALNKMLLEILRFVTFYPCMHAITAIYHTILTCDLSLFPVHAAPHFKAHFISSIEPDSKPNK